MSIGLEVENHPPDGVVGDSPTRGPIEIDLGMSPLLGRARIRNVKRSGSANNRTS